MHIAVIEECFARGYLVGIMGLEDEGYKEKADSCRFLDLVGEGGGGVSCEG